MSKFQVTIQGANYPIKRDGEVEYMGFEATRTVKADNKTKAEIEALRLIANDAELKSLVDPDTDAKPTVIIQSVKRVGWWKLTGGKGFDFYNMMDRF